MFTLTPQVYFAINPFINLNWGLKYQFNQKNRVDDKVVSNSGSSVGYLFGGSYEFSSKTVFELNYENMVKQEYDYNLEVAEKTILDDVLESKGLSKEDKNEFENSDMNLSFYDLGAYANSLNFKAVGMSLDLDSLKKLQVPVILFVKVRKDEHFTVYKSMDENFVYLADPTFGNIKISIAKFEEMFYQREDLTHPGKILAIIPKRDDVKMNKDFTKIEIYTNGIYDRIRNNISK